jgi:endonuclease/exonuclease/phosphatase (EEP) superfamily protein YafD
MLPILAFLTTLAILVTLLPLSRCPHWIVKALDFPRLQFAVSIAILLIAQFFLLDGQSTLTWLLIAATALCFLRQLWWILPYTFIWPKEVKTSSNNLHEKQLSILTANVLTPNRKSEGLIQLIKEHKPDILVTLESDQWWEDQLSVLEQEMPYSVKCPLDNLYGMHVFSRLPLVQKHISYLVEKDVPSIHASLKLRTGDLVRMHFLHPAPPSPTENSQSGERDAELMIVARAVAESSLPIVVTGDLNDVAWSATTRLFRKISGLLDPRVGRGMFNTFHADYRFLRWPLDHLFHSQHFTLESIQRLPSIGSDHFALLTKLMFSPTEGASQNSLQPDASDQAWSKELVKDQGVTKDETPQLEEANKL